MEVSGEVSEEVTKVSDLPDDWEKISLDVAHFDLLSNQLEALVVLGSIVRAAVVTGRSQPAVVAAVEVGRLTVDTVLRGGRGAVSSMVARWAVKYCVPPAILSTGTSPSTASRQHSSSSDVTDVPPSPDVLPPVFLRQEPFERRLAALLADAKNEFPYGLYNDALHGSTAWEYVATWSRDTSLSVLLEDVPHHVSRVVNPLVRHGLCALLWTTFLKDKVRAATHLMEKVGKPPKDRLCRRDVGVSDSGLAVFLEVTEDILDTLVDSNVNSEEVAIYGQLEQLWRGDGEEVGPSPLVELTCDQKETNAGLVEHHANLVTVLHMIMALNIRQIRPLSVFDTRGGQCFFLELTAHPLLPSDPDIDLGVAVTRRAFLCAALSGAVHRGSTGGRADRDVWVRKVFSLAAVWNTSDGNLDAVRRHLVWELYSAGEDALAQEATLPVADRVMLANQVLMVAGARFKAAAREGGDRHETEWLSSASGTLHAWLQTTDSPVLARPVVAARDIDSMLQFVMTELDEGEAMYKMALDMRHALKSHMDDGES